MKALRFFFWRVLKGTVLLTHCLVCVCVAGELLSVAEQFLEQQMHPTVVISAYRQALDHILEALREIR